jgi:chromosome segregation ATPase
MSETVHEWEQAEATEAPHHEPEAEGGFADLAGALREEHERLVRLGDACRRHAELLVERERELSERERRVGEAEASLAARHGELEQRERHLNELAARAADAEARLAEAAEREAALAAFGSQLLERFGADGHAGA